MYSDNKHTHSDGKDRVLIVVAVVVKRTHTHTQRQRRARSYRARAHTQKLCVHSANVSGSSSPVVVVVVVVRAAPPHLLSSCAQYRTVCAVSPISCGTENLTENTHQPKIQDLERKTPCCARAHARTQYIQCYLRRMSDVYGKNCSPFGFPVAHTYTLTLIQTSTHARGCV